mgnify:CR=1
MCVFCQGGVTGRQPYPHFPRYPTSSCKQIHARYPLDQVLAMDGQSPIKHGLLSFPIDPQAFDADDRISYSKLDQKFLLVADDGSEYEFDDALRRWIPVLDDELAQQQQAAYKVQGVDEEETVEDMRRKRKKEYVNGEEVSGSLSSCPLSPAGP